MKRILGLIAGILLILGGIALILRDPADLSSLSLYTGPLTVESGAEDPDFDISVDSPVLIRKVEMYQYIAVGRDQYTRDFSERYERNLGAEKNDIYKNSQFPKGLESELFFGKVRIGDVLLGKEYLKNFSYSSYVNFSEQPEIYPVNVEEGGSKRFGLELLDPYTYATPGGGEWGIGDFKVKKWDIGDLKVSWYAVDDSGFARSYTAVGTVRDGVLSEGDGSSLYFYDREISKEELSRENEEGDRRVGIGMILVGLLLSAFFIYRIKTD